MTYVREGLRNKTYSTVSLHGLYHISSFLFLHQVWMVGGLWNPLWGDLHLTVYWQRPKKWTDFFSHLRWQNVLYLAESLHSCPIHWYVLTILLIKPCGKCKISIIPRIRLAICLSIHVWNWFDCEEGKFVFECIEHSRWVFRKPVQASLNLLLSILKTNTVHHYRGNWFAYLR